MMEVLLTEKARKQLVDLPSDLRDFFIKHLEKIGEIPPRKHMRYGIPCHVEKVTKQARLIYQIEEDRIYVLQCFAGHKEYERWYRAYK
jgi:mRNA-degrading endonuclease RelE of RelBE toxin-antitoxin system